MKKIMFRRLLLGVVLGLSGAACQKEEITPSIAFPQLYEIKDNADDPVQHRRYELWKTYNVPVYFNDTIAKTFVGMDHAGDSVFRTETIDLNWGFTSQEKNTHFEYVYLTDEEEQMNALEVVEKYLASLSVPLRPFSVLVTRSALSVTGGAGTEVPNKVGYRTVLITGVEQMTEKEAAEMVQLLKKEMIKNKMSNYTDELTAFNKISKEWFNTMWTNLPGVPDGFSSSKRGLFGPLSEEALKEIRLVVGRFGFLGGQNDNVISWIGGGRYSPENKDDDLNMYLDEMLSYSKTEFKTRWGHAPLVMEKYDILYGVIAEKLEVEL